MFVGSGDFIWCTSKSSGMAVMVQGVTFTLDLYHLAIVGADFMFGLSWMKSLGRVLTDYNELTMEFL